MKNKYYEYLRRSQKAYHRRSPWRLSPEGLYIPHTYEYTEPDSLSWWDDVGFILGSRRVMVWWRHPRHVYAERADDLAYEEAGPSPSPSLFFEARKIYKPAGASRKKLVGSQLREFTEEQAQYYDRLRELKHKYLTGGEIPPVLASVSLVPVSWALGVELVAPLEVRNENELAVVAGLARRLARRVTSMEVEFPGYCYAAENWNKEHRAGQDTPNSHLLA